MSFVHPTATLIESKTTDVSENGDRDKARVGSVTISYNVLAYVSCSCQTTTWDGKNGHDGDQLYPHWNDHHGLWTLGGYARCGDCNEIVAPIATLTYGGDTAEWADDRARLQTELEEQIVNQGPLDSHQIATKLVTIPSWFLYHWLETANVSIPDEAFVRATATTSTLWIKTTDLERLEADATVISWERPYPVTAFSKGLIASAKATVAVFC